MASSEVERISISMVIVQCEDTLKTHIDVTKVADTMLKSEKADIILGKTTRKRLDKSMKKPDIKLFLAVLKCLKLPEFALLLESLEQIGDKNHLTALTTIATHIPNLSLPTSPQDDAAKTTLQDEAAKKVKQIHSVYFKQTKHRDVPEQVFTMVESLTISDDSSQSLGTTILPSTEQTDIELATVSRSFTGDDSISVSIGRDGGLLYSPVHGVTVSVPATAVPHNIHTFELTMTASLTSTVPIGPDYIPCSAIVSLTTSPKIGKFLDHITVSIPHCGVSMQDYHTFYCLLSHSDGQPSFEEDASIEVDFTSDWRYFSFRTMHFTRYLAAAKQKDPTRKQPMRLAKLKSKSLEQTPEVKAVVKSEFHRSASDPLSQSTYLPDVRYCLGMFTPLRKEGLLWKVVFLTCLDVQTGHAVMEQDALRLLRLGGVHLLDPGSPRISFMFKQDCSAIEFSPTACNSDGWTFTASKTPAVITKEDMEYRTIQPRQDTSYAPHGLTYLVRKTADAADSVCQQFRVDGILSCYGDQIKSRDVSFTLVAESATQQMLLSATEYIIEELYHPASKILGAIRGEVNPSEVELKPDDSETMIFMAELSFGTTSLKWVDLAKDLKLHGYDINNIEAFYHDSTQKEEAAFQMMLLWLRTSVERTTLQRFMRTLERNGITIRIHKLNGVHSCEGKQIHQQSMPRNTIAEISKRIAKLWKFIGRFLGITESNISLVASQGGSGVEGHYKLVEQAVAMLDHWGGSNGYQATLFKLENAIYALHKHTGHKLIDAIDFLARPFQ